MKDINLYGGSFIDTWRKALDTYALQRPLRKEEKALRSLITAKEQLQSQLTALEKQESDGMDCTIDQMLPKDIAIKWGLDEHGHKRNTQHIFMRCCQAISDLESQLTAEKEANHWIPVAERLPKKDWSDVDGPFLVIVKGGGLMLATFCFIGNSWMNLRGDPVEPTRWCLIPEGE